METTEVRRRSPSLRVEEDDKRRNQQHTVSFDDMPITSTYALKQQKALGARRYSKSPKNAPTPQKPPVEELNVGHLYMYLPQGMRFDRQSGFVPLSPTAKEVQQKKTKTKVAASKEKDTRFKQDSKVFYHKDYSDFQYVKEEAGAKTESTTKRQPMRSIHRPAGVNFKVELNETPSMSSLPKVAGGNLKTIQKHLQRLGVRYDLMQEYLKK